jgi:uncharacterized protein (DUF58 family)
MLAPDEARLLDRLTLGGNSSSVLPSAAGVRRARTRGAGLEFHEYRRYQAGDDPRSIDWTVEARLRQLVVRVSRAEGHVRLHVLIDSSASMSVGTPDKLACARRIAAALCYVAVERRDAAGVSTFGEGVRTYMPPVAGRAQLFRAFEAIASLTPSGASSIEHALESYAAAVRGPGLVAVLSDFFEPGAGLRGLQSLLHRNLTPAVVQIVAREEMAPHFVGDTELVDIEQAGGPALIVDERAITAYQARLDEQETSLRSFCATHGCPYARVESDASFQQLLAAVEAGGLLGAHA